MRLQRLVLCFVSLLIGTSAIADCGLNLPPGYVKQSYQGGCLNGLAEGQGNAVVGVPSKSGAVPTRFTGEFALGSLTGQGAFTTESGQLSYSGTFRAWLPVDGIATRTDASGKVARIQFTNGSGRMLAEQPSQGQAIASAILQGIGKAIEKNQERETERKLQQAGTESSTRTISAGSGQVIQPGDRTITSGQPIQTTPEPSRQIAAATGQVIQPSSRTIVPGQALQLADRTLEPPKQISATSGQVISSSDRTLATGQQQIPAASGQVNQPGDRTITSSQPIQVIPEPTRQIAAATSQVIQPSERTIVPGQALQLADRTLEPPKQIPATSGQLFQFGDRTVDSSLPLQVNPERPPQIAVTPSKVIASSDRTFATNAVLPENQPKTSGKQTNESSITPATSAISPDPILLTQIDPSKNLSVANSTPATAGQQPGNLEGKSIGVAVVAGTASFNQSLLDLDRIIRHGNESGGHPDLHVGRRSQQEMEVEASKRAGKTFSTFDSEQKFRQAAQKALVDNENKIKDWFRTAKANARQVVETKMPIEIGDVYREGKIVRSSTVRLVIKRVITSEGVEVIGLVTAYVIASIVAH